MRSIVRLGARGHHGTSPNGPSRSRTLLSGSFRLRCPFIMRNLMQQNELISHIRSRVTRCRQLASMITDERAATVLRQMAEEGEADIRRLQEQAASPDSE